MKLGLVHAAEPAELPKLSELADKFLLTPDDPSAPDWTRSVASWGMYLNDQLGVCTIAGAANTRAMWGAYTGRERIMTDAEVLENFAKIGGTDQGATIDQLMQGWFHGLTIGGIPDKIVGYASIDSKNHQEIEDAVRLFGAVETCWALPEMAIEQYQQLLPWALGGPGDAAAGSEGGHLTCTPRITATGGATITWTTVQEWTWDFWDAYVVRCAVALSPDWLIGSGSANPAGVNWSGLASAMAALTKSST